MFELRLALLLELATKNRWEVVHFAPMWKKFVSTLVEEI